MYKDTAVGNVVAETGRDLVFETTARLSNLSMSLTGEVRRSPEPSAIASLQGHRRQPIARSGKFVRRAYSRRALDCAYAFSDRARFQRQRCWKRGSGDGQRLTVFMTTARLSDLSMPLKGEVRRSPEQSARQPIARSGKFIRRAYSRRALDCEKTTVLCFLPSWSTLLFERGLGEEGRFDEAARSETPKPSCQSHKQQAVASAQWPK